MNSTAHMYRLQHRALLWLRLAAGPQMQSAKCSSLVTPDIGWWGYVLFNPGAFYSTTLDAGLLFIRDY